MLIFPDVSLILIIIYVESCGHLPKVNSDSFREKRKKKRESAVLDKYLRPKVMPEPDEL